MPKEAYLDGLVQGRRNSSALAMELRLPYINQSICVRNLDSHWFKWWHVACLKTSSIDKFSFIKTNVKIIQLWK